MPDLKSYLPWVQTPLIINAPMAGFAGASLAAKVTQSDGLGLIGSAFSMEELRTELQLAKETFSKSNPNLPPSDQLPVGVGFLPFVANLSEALPLIQEYKPVVVWLFAARSTEEYAEWASKVREVSPQSKIWIQTGTVASALALATFVHPDALVLQGSDAGGHGYQKSASIISLLPEASDALKAAGFSKIPLIASGGIADGRGVAAALTLGASAVVMGTRFLASNEITIHPQYRAAVLEAIDGGQATVRSKVFDELRGPNIWPHEYDGRSIVNRSFADFAVGMNIEEVRRLFREETLAEDKGYKVKGEGRAAIWAGTGVGLVRGVESAENIVTEVREEAKGVFGAFQEFIG